MNELGKSDRPSYQRSLRTKPEDRWRRGWREGGWPRGNIERRAVVDVRQLMRDVLKRSLGELLSQRSGSGSNTMCATPGTVPDGMYLLAPGEEDPFSAPGTESAIKPLIST